MGIDTTSYMASVCGDVNFVQFTTNSKSGQFFFFTRDGDYMIKTVSHEEVKEMQRIMGSYYEHLRANPASFLCRVLGLYRVQVSVPAGPAPHKHARACVRACVRAPSLSPTALPMALVPQSLAPWFCRLFPPLCHVQLSCDKLGVGLAALGAQMYHLNRTVYFIVMASAYKGAGGPMDAQYDCKGSHVGRSADPGDAVKKDNDLLEDGFRLRLGPNREKVPPPPDRRRATPLPQPPV